MWSSSSEIFLLRYVKQKSSIQIILVCMSLSHAIIHTIALKGGPSHGVDWALKHDLLESIYQKLSDEEAYVRAAGVHAFEIVMRDSRGWNGMCLKSLDKRLSGQLPALIRDSEAFVRRAVLDAMVCLVSERESGSVLMVNGTDLFVE